MSQTRLEQLLELLKNEPHDPFLKYGLALEYSKYDKPEAKKYFDILLSEHPDYVATYYHAAKLQESLLNKEEAIKIYQRGIQIAQEAKERHAEKELKNALNLLLFEDDD